MGLVATKVFDAELVGHLNVRGVTLAFDSSYPTGGEVITANALRLSNILMAIIPGNKGFTFEWDGANLKVLVYWVDTTVDGAPMVEVVDTTTLVSITAAPAIFIGT